MAWNGSGTFARIYNWVARAAVPATKYIDAISMDAEFDNYKSGLEACLTRNGETTPSANLPMATFRHTGVGAATALTDYARASEVQKGTLWKAASPGGTIDAMTGTITPAPTLTAGMLISIIAPGTGSNTVTAPTVTLNGGSAVTIKKHQSALVAGDYTAGDSLLLLYDGTYAELLNPKYPVAEATAPAHSTFTTDSTGGALADFLPFVDASDSNADNKVLVSDFLANVLANVSAKSPAVGADKILIADSAASGAAKSVLVTALLAALNDLTADTAPDLAADYVLTYDNSASAAKKTLAKNIGAGKQTIWVPAGSMNTRSDTSGGGPTSTTTTSTTNKILTVTKDFDQTTQEYVQFQIAMPKGWNEGTVTFQAYWKAASGTGDVVWSLSGGALSSGDTIDTAITSGAVSATAQTLISTSVLHVTTESSAVTLNGSPAAGDLVTFQVSRVVGSDNLSADAQLIGIKLYYTTDATTDE